MTPATPRPWKYEYNPTEDEPYAICPENPDVPVVGDVYQQADAELIVRAINTFDHAKAALAWALPQIHHYALNHDLIKDEKGCLTCQKLKWAEAVLTQMEEE